MAARESLKVPARLPRRQLIKAGRMAAGALLSFICVTAAGAELRVDVRDAAGAPLTDMVVYAEALEGVPAPPATGVHAVIDQVHKQFVPRVSVIQKGTLVDFPNSDNIRHEVYSFSEPRVFTTKLYSGKQAAPVEFDKPGAVALGCNIHDNMIAWVRVVDTPYFGKSGADGTSTLSGLKPGDYRLSVWYPGPNSEPKVRQVHVGAEGAREAVQIEAPVPALAAPAVPATY
jgi:plastocyanin